MTDNRKIIPGLTKKKLFNFKPETYTLIVTKNETIFARLTNKIMQDIVKEAKDKAKAEGKGFFKQWGAQMGASFNYSDRYVKMPLDKIKTEAEGTFVIINSSIEKIKVRDNYDSSSGRTYHDVTMIIDGVKNKFTAKKSLKKMFKEVYGSKVI